MALNNAQYDSIIRTYEEKQNRNRRLLSERYEQVIRAVPAYRQAEDAIASVSVEQGKKLLEGDGLALSQLKERIRFLSCEKKKLLLSAGYPQDYLDPVYGCPDCKDTGFIEGRKCHCFLKAQIDLLYEQSHIRESLKQAGFASLSREYYTGEDLKLFESAVAASHNFVETFNYDYLNLFFYGTVGTGKSFLSGCIAKELIENGHSVIYFSSSGLFETLSQFSFDYKNKEELHRMYEDLHQCDLLIIDDLGTELTNSFVTSQLFSCLNERHMRRKATLISTNLSLSELRDRYSDRIFSRITSHYEICKLSGPDIRIYQKLHKHTSES